MDAAVFDICRGSAYALRRKDRGAARRRRACRPDDNGYRSGRTVHIYGDNLGGDDKGNGLAELLVAELPVRVCSADKRGADICAESGLLGDSGIVLREQHSRELLPLHKAGALFGNGAQTVQDDNSTADICASDNGNSGASCESGRRSGDGRIRYCADADMGIVIFYHDYTIGTKFFAEALGNLIKFV